MENKIVHLTPKGDRWAKSRHPWVYQDDLKKPDAALSGEIVRVESSTGRPLGQAFYNAVSKIALRWLTHDPEISIDPEFWGNRLRVSLEYRQRIVQETNACRLIFSEADGFPGLIVDRYGDSLVLQSLSLGMERLLPQIVDLLSQALKPKAIVARNDSNVRTLEGLPLEKKVILGQLPDRIEASEGDRRYLVDVWQGHKTGAYLDQRENRLFARRFARGRVLDAFAYQGGFSLQVASQADEVLAIEDSEWAISGLKSNLALNQLTHVRVEKENAFDRLRALDQKGERFDLAILDPPAFAKSRKELPDAVRGYREINLRALKILQKGGFLLTCSCSYLVSDELFAAILREAVIDSQRAVRFVESRTQSRDHPILITHPESKYLKCFVLEVIE